MASRLQEKYNKEVAPALMEKFGYQMFILLLLSRAIFLMLKNCVRENYY